MGLYWHCPTIRSILHPHRYKGVVRSKKTCKFQIDWPSPLEEKSWNNNNTPKGKNSEKRPPPPSIENKVPGTFCGNNNRRYRLNQYVSRQDFEVKKSPHSSNKDPPARGINQQAPLQDKSILINYKMLPKLQIDPPGCFEKNNYGTNINPNTLRNRVRDGLTGPPRKGRPPILPKMVEDALAEALTTFVALTAAQMKDKPDRQMLLQKVTACLSNGVIPFPLTDPVSLFRRLQPQFADGVEVSDLNSQMEERRGHEGELYVPPEQLRRIINVDETGLSLDTTTTKSRGRPVTQYGPTSRDLPVGASHANKSRDPMPPHFQLKSMAKDDANKRIQDSFLEELEHNTVTGTWGFNKPTERWSTVNCNASAGMDGTEFTKVVKDAYMPLYPDLAPVPGKRVVLLVDSGPGREDNELQIITAPEGLCLLTGVPNTTHIWQPTDQNYGPFKTMFRQNKTMLNNSRRARRLTMRSQNIPRLVFGGQETEYVTLHSAFHDAFSVEKSKAIWRHDSGSNDGKYGLKGDAFAAKAPRNNEKEKITSTKPGGFVTNSKDVWKAKVLKECMKKIATLKTTKARAAAFAKKKGAAEALVAKCGGEFARLAVQHLKVIYDWKFAKKVAAGMKKEQIVAVLVNAKDDPPVGVVEWSEECDGAELQRLEKAEITMKETLLGKAMAEKLEKCVQTIKEVTPELLEIVALDDGKIEYIKRMQATRGVETTRGLELRAV
eukprot:jgi/Psemu1/5464/gm1.5464_g